VRSTLGVGSVFYIVMNRVHGTDHLRAESRSGAVTPPDRVLVIQEDPRDQGQLVEAFTQAGFEVDATGDSAEALSQARDVRYAALTLDLSLPSQRGLDLLADIRSQGASHATPVVGVTMPTDESAATFSIANLLCKPIRSDEILLAMAPYKLPESGRANVLVIDDDQIALDLMRATLKSIGIEAVCEQDGREALRHIDQTRPDAIILDLMMPEFDGFQVLDALQRLPAWRHVPVYVWTSLLLTEEEYAALARSARAIVMKGGGAMEDLLERVRRLRPAIAAVLDGEPP
jgi:DNA-binding response OmpR family regulator